jgi:hypothetical protein
MTTVEIAGKLVGHGQPTFIVAGTSANHDQDLSQALEQSIPSGGPVSRKSRKVVQAGFRW